MTFTPIRVLHGLKLDCEIASEQYHKYTVLLINIYILLLDKKKKRKGVILQPGSGPEDCGSSGESEGIICIGNYVFIIQNYICINVLYS